MSVTGSQKKRSTRTLLRHYKEGDRKALAELLGRKEGNLLNWIRGFLGRRKNKVDPQDILQEVNLHVVTKVDRFEDRFTGAFSRWMEGVARNKIRNALRKKKEHEIPSATEPGSSHEGPHHEGPKGREETPSETMAKQESRVHLLEALQVLPEPQRKVLWLRDFEELSFEEIAKRMGKPSAEAAAKFYWRSVEKLGEAFRGTRLTR